MLRVTTTMSTTEATMRESQEDAPRMTELTAILRVMVQGFTARMEKRDDH